VELRFDAMLYSNLGNKNSDTGHIKCLRGLQVPYPCAKQLAVSVLPPDEKYLLGYFAFSRTLLVEVVM